MKIQLLRDEQSIFDCMKLAGLIDGSAELEGNDAIREQCGIASFRGGIAIQSNTGTVKALFGEYIERNGDTITVSALPTG